MKRRIGVVLLLVLLPLTSFGLPRSRDLLFYQGFLSDIDGRPVNKAANVTFRLYESSAGGKALWEEPQTVTVENGLYVTTLGAKNRFPSDLFNRETLFLGIQIEGEAAEMSPRFGLYSVPWAEQAEVAQLAQLAMTAKSLADNVVTSAKIVPGAVGTNELAPTGVVPGKYSLSTITVDAKGRITQATSGAIPPFAIANGGVGTPQIADGAVTAAKLAPGTIGPITDGSVSTIKLQDKAVTAAKIAPGAITNAAISSSGTVDGKKINPNFGNRNVTTSGDISTTGSGSIDAAGWVSAPHFHGTGGTPSITTDEGAGFSPPSVEIVGTDVAGMISLTTDAAPLAGGGSPKGNSVVVTVTFAKKFDKAPTVMLAPVEPNAASLTGTKQVYVDQPSTADTDFTIRSGATPLSDSTLYRWNYLVIR